MIWHLNDFLHKVEKPTPEIDIVQASADTRFLLVAVVFGLEKLKEEIILSLSIAKLIV